MKFWRWLAVNLHLFLLALVLAVAVWVSAVTASDPDETRVYPVSIPIEFVGQDPTLIISNSPPTSVQVSLRAPRSVWEMLTTQKNTVRVVADLTGLAAGQHRVNLRVQVAVRPVRVLSITPSVLDLTLEPLVTRTLPVQVIQVGEPAIGYLAGDVEVDPTLVVAAGPQSVMNQLTGVRLILDLTGVRQNVETVLPVQAVDANDRILANLTIHPDKVSVKVPVIQQGGYRDLAVKVVVQGRVANGYRLTSISVFPPVVTAYSQDPQRVNALPGYVETEALNLNGANANFETTLALVLPGGISVIGDQTVTVQVGISPIEGSLTLTARPIEVINLAPGLKAQLSPQRVDIILSGPLPILDTLQATDVRVVVDAQGLTSGVYQVRPMVEIRIQGVVVESLLPEMVEITISLEMP